MNKKITRRDLLQLISVVTGAAGLCLPGRMLKLPVVGAQSTPPGPPEVYLPAVYKSSSSIATPTRTPTPTPTKTPTPTRTPNIPSGPGPKVIHVHAANAVTWTGSPSAYWNYVDQDVVNSMVNLGVQALTGSSNLVDAWRTLIPGYVNGDGIAIKVSFNNAFHDCNNSSGSIDALIHPVNAVISGLKQIGVPENDIWVFDAIRAIPGYFRAGCLFSGIKYYRSTYANCPGTYPATFNSASPDAFISFHPPSGVPQPSQVKAADLLLNARYLINIPIMKPHSAAGVSLGFKNHFGSIDLPGNLHNYCNITLGSYRSDYSPFVDIYNNPNVGAKTRLIIGDGIFAAMHYTSPPQPWTSFGGQFPKSLFFATDPVAIDCVMSDIIGQELTVDPKADDYLRLAGSAGLGVHERGDPNSSSGYQYIRYSRQEI